MKVKGKYIRDINEFRDCELYIERGKIYEVSLPDLSHLKASSYIPNNKSEFSFERLPSKNTVFVPYDSNYLIEYLGRNGSTSRIYLKLNFIQRFRTKWVLRQYILQSKDMKIDIVKYFIGGFIGLIFGYVGSIVIPIKDIETKTDKINTNEFLKLESKKDTINTDSIKIDTLSKK